ncbi:hypothetical protein NHQ30_008913 [Ciborinia camelliae]|nr:hypothetical protein NHQ30_008913 [Ciborinia camelliae]
MSVDMHQLKLAGQWAVLYVYPENQPNGCKTDGESDFTIETEVKDEKVIIRGKGRDKVGHFTFRGHVDGNATVYFKKDYTSHWWHCSGSVDPETNMMYGKWGVHQEEQGGGDYFAFHLVNENDEDEDISPEYANIKGAWSGFYISAQSGTNRRCSFEEHGHEGSNSDLLTVKGNGRAGSVEYKFTGVVFKSGQLTFAKVYGQHVYL